jgi:hypothetical protein
MGDHRMTWMLRLCAGRGREGTSGRPRIRSAGSPIDTRERTVFAAGNMLSTRHESASRGDRSLSARVLPQIQTPRDPRAFLTPTKNFDNDFNIPAADGARCRSPNARCLHPSLKHRQGRLWDPTRSNRSRFRQYPPGYDPGMFPPTLRRQTAHSRPF